MRKKIIWTNGYRYWRSARHWAGDCQRTSESEIQSCNVGSFILQKTDIVDLAAVQEGYAESVKTLGRIDIFVKNTGINDPVIDSR